MQIVKSALPAPIVKKQIRTPQIDTIRNELIKAESVGFTDKAPEVIMQEVIKRKRADGEL